MSRKDLSYERYQRQILLRDFGEKGQQQLFGASVLVVGAGGLGCPALQYLAAAGVGKIGIVDDDLVSLHNLHRQVLFTTEDIGKAKAGVAAKRLESLNPEIELATFPFRLTNQNALTIIGEFDIVLDATDNFASRYLINDACVLLHKPLVYGAISQFEGQVAVFQAAENSVNYRDLFPEPPPPGSVLNCAEAGVLGVLPGIIGTLQATEVIKLLTGIGKPLVNQLFTYNALTNESFVFDLATKKQTASLLPKTAAEYERLDYEWLCEGPVSVVEEMDTAAFNACLHEDKTLVIDVREEGEQPEITSFSHRKLPLSRLKENIPAIDANTVVLFCQSGKRSREAAALLSATFGKTKKIYSLKGGILNWKANGKEA
ncbi:HesA/MoeB/ThiF family protein [Flavisolibacter nicotianae]|uniref:HesA/MoeB/ThiF family protein n=1 Tax=Flavisolibacter nicotianae TaxID=2364882 RepID=UPI000EABE53D|nr:HesA/MoeB/ThiF family protein [Flavisolibacter nicotianae]